MTGFVIAGAGRQGIACAEFLLRRFADVRVLLVDREPQAVDRALTALAQAGAWGDRLSGFAGDAFGEAPTLARALAEAACLVSCAPYGLNERLTDMAIEHGLSFCDLGGNLTVVRRQIARDERARARGVCVVPDCGLAPGSAGVLAMWWRGDWRYRRVKMLCGGLAQREVNAFGWEPFFSPQGLLNEYLEPCTVSRGGAVVTVEPLSEMEFVEDIAAVGPLEAVQTSGGASLMPELFAPEGIDCEYKTLRRPGHWRIIRALREIGLCSEDATWLRANGGAISPREVVETLLDRNLVNSRRDLVVLRVDVEGERGGVAVRGRIDVIDRAQGRLTAMERTTGFSQAIVAAHLAGLLGERPAPGARPPFQVLPPALLAEELRREGVEITVRELV